MAQRRSKAPRDEAVTVDAVITKLEGVVEELERGEMPLEESLRRFEEGIALSRKGHELLAALEERVEKLLDDGHTRVELEPAAAASDIDNDDG